MIFTQVSAWIAIPVVLALYIGRYFDTKYGTTPAIFVSLTILAFIVSVVGMWKVLSRYMKEVDRKYIENKNKDGKSN